MIVKALFVFAALWFVQTAFAFAEPQYLRKYRIIDCHEHIQSVSQAETAIAVMDQIGIEKIALVGSPWFTITMNEKYGFTRYDWNNNQLLKIMKKYKGRFEAWPTINPLDNDKLDIHRNRGDWSKTLYRARLPIFAATRHIFVPPHRPG